MLTKRRTFRKVLSVMLCLVLVFSLCLVTGTANAKHIVGYFTEWGIYAAHNYYEPSNIPWSKITAVNYAFSKPTTSGIVLYDSYADVEKSYPGDVWDQPLKGAFNQLIKYKALYPNVKTLISLGGWTLSGEFSNIALTDSSRTFFANDCVRFLRQYQFDGIDIDWEYPVGGGLPGNVCRPEDKHNFTLLLQNIRSKLTAAGTADGKYYYLTIAAPAGYNIITNTEPNLYHQYLDWINLMTYDYHGAWDTVTNHLAPLYKNPSDPSPIDIRDKYNTDWTVSEYLRLGCPASKLNVGLPYYSRGWKEVNGGINGLYATANGAPMGIWDDGTSGPTGTNPFYHVKGVMELAAGYTKYRDNTAKVPYLFSPTDKIMYTYDDETSIGVKCDYINSRGLGGAMFWEFSGDYPSKGSTLTNLINSKIGGGGATSTPTPTAAPTPTATPTGTNTPTPTATPTGTNTPTPTATPTATPTPIATPTPTGGGAAPWAPNTPYIVNQLCTYSGSTYKCLQAHTSLVGWEPPIVPALWQLQ